MEREREKLQFISALLLDRPMYRPRDSSTCQCEIQQSMLRLVKIGELEKSSTYASRWKIQGAVSNLRKSKYCLNDFLKHHLEPMRYTVAAVSVYLSVGSLLSFMADRSVWHPQLEWEVHSGFSSKPVERNHLPHLQQRATLSSTKTTIALQTWITWLQKRERRSLRPDLAA